jgi:hypothetical protein
MAGAPGVEAAAPGAPGIGAPPAGGLAFEASDSSIEGREGTVGASAGRAMAKFRSSGGKRTVGASRGRVTATLTAGAGDGSRDAAGAGAGAGGEAGAGAVAAGDAADEGVASSDAGGGVAAAPGEMGTRGGGVRSAPGRSGSSGATGVRSGDGVSMAWSGTNCCVFCPDSPIHSASALSSVSVAPGRAPASPPAGVVSLSRKPSSASRPANSLMPAADSSTP